MKTRDMSGDLTMQLTADQKTKLAMIKNPQQREMLLDAIRQGMEIPEYAWQPLPADLNMDEMFAQMSEVTEEIADESGADARDLESASVQDFHLEQIALQAQKTATAATHFLCEPISLDEPIESPTGKVELLRWGIFNPNGPTACELSLETAASIDSTLLAFHAFHPFSPSAFVYGLLSAEVISNRAAMLRCLSALFSQNGSADAPMFLSAPTHVIVPDDSPLSTADARGLFESALADASSEDLRESYDLIKRHWCEPWQRAAEERDRAYATAFARLRKGSSVEERKKPQLSKGEVFAQWWQSVTDADHIAAEMREMPAAWHGAIAQIRGNFVSK